VDGSAQDGLTGRLVDGRYRVGARIARGGMATVYQAVDERLGRDVALKVMHPDLAEDRDFVARFISEARSAAALSRHRTIVTVFDQGASDGLVWLALELVHGRTLRQALVERGRLDPATALAVIEPVLTALAAAHEAGIVHRDVKPENVLIGDDGHVQVADFGLAHAVTASSHPHRGLTTRGLMLGTVAYISPEQALGEQATPRSDVYAAGIVLDELLTGHPPYAGPTDYVVVRRHVDEDVPPPSAEVPGVPAEVDALVLAATARDPQRRYPDARAFLGAVQQARRTLSPGAAVAAVTGLREVGGGEPVAAVAAAAGVLVGGSAASDGRPVGYDTNPIHSTTATIAAVAPAGEPAGPQASDAERPAPDDPFATPPRPPRRRRGRTLVLLLALVAALAAGAWWVADGRSVATPGFVGMTQQQAERAAERAGLLVQVTGEQYSETIDAGRVVGSQPGEGTAVQPGATVGLLISLGPERYDVPEVVGLTRRQADRALTDQSLVIGEVARAFDEQVPAGRIVAQDPAPGASVKPETPVSIVVSRGPRPIEVPDVVGDPVDEAVAEIEQAGLVAATSERFSDDVERGRVVSQQPGDGTLTRGDTVALVVSLGPRTVEVPDVEGEDAAEAAAELEQAGLVVRRIELLPAGPNQVLRQAPTAGQTVRVGSEVSIYVF
jgi:serine/threonine-protein kinase